MEQLFQLMDIQLIEMESLGRILVDIAMADGLNLAMFFGSLLVVIKLFSMLQMPLEQMRY